MAKDSRCNRRVPRDRSALCVVVAADATGSPVAFRRDPFAHPPVVDEVPVLAAYKARCEERPAFKKALADQMAAFKKYAPKK